MFVKATRYPSLQLSDISGTGGAGHSHTLSFNQNGTPLPAENSPRRLFERLFVPDTAGDRAASLRRYAERRSILDEVAAEAKALDRRLGTEDRRKLDEYYQSVRDTEQLVGTPSGVDRCPETECHPGGIGIGLPTVRLPMTARCGWM
jgi:hypothetical protein